MLYVRFLDDIAALQKRVHPCVVKYRKNIASAVKYNVRKMYSMTFPVHDMLHSLMQHVLHACPMLSVHTLHENVAYHSQCCKIQCIHTCIHVACM